MRDFNYKIGKKIDLKNTKDFTKAHDVYVFVSQGGRRKYYNTQVKCKLRNFDGEKVVGVPDAKFYNRQIDDTVKEVLNLIQSVIDEYNTFNIDLLSKVKKNILSQEDNFIKWVETCMPVDNLTDGTLKNNKATIKVLKEFGIFETFFDVNIINVEKYDKYLKKQNYTYETVHKHHAKLRSFIRKAIIAGYELQDPYQQFKLKKPKPSKLKYLEEGDLQKIIDFQPQNVSLEKTRDLFVFQAMTGLAYVDAIKVSKKDIKIIQGKKYIIDKRQKTLQEYSIRLFQEAENILEKYDYKMDYITNQAYNRYLKLMALALGIREDLSSHMARHTFATIALNRGVPLAIVAKMLGHSSTQCTEIYAQYLQSTIQREGYDKLEDVFG